MKKIKIGLDFDGVVAYNPFRIIRAPVAYIKTQLLGVKELKFFVPQSKWERIFWIIAHESSMFPARGCKMLKSLSGDPDLEFHLVTARFHFLDQSLNRWLNRFKLTHIFKSINLNVEDKQPHIHKLDVIKKLDLDYFVEDNWDIVNYLNGKTKAKICWIYNIGDWGKEYKYKFPYLEKALVQIMKS
jgi:hypothetical protein